VIDLTVAGKRRHGRWNETSEIKGFHIGFLRWVDVGSIVGGPWRAARRSRATKTTEVASMPEDTDRAFQI
jgi:hypothetical protein